MKALSLRQPWAWAVLHAGKRIENRTWKVSFRGQFLVHAAKGCTVREYDGAVEWMLGRGLVAASHAGPLPVVPPLEDLERGGIVARATLVAILSPSKEGPRSPWHMEDQHGFVLDDVVALPFTSCRGLQRFFDLEEPPGQRIRVAELADQLALGVEPATAPSETWQIGR